jgi:lipopolysaccharide transport system ATP-binding protein
MSDIALRVEGLSKRYRLGLQESSTGGMYRYKSLRDSLGQFAQRPLHALRSALTREAMNDQNSFWALKDINFEVKRGEVVGIIGRNGAGKSTLLKILSRITKPTTGRVALYGRVGSLLEVGTGFHPELTGRENIYLNGAILGMSRAEVKAKFDEIVSFSGIDKFLDMAVKHYSSGMYTRLAFAVAANLSPEILIVDEVLAVGDAEFQKKCLGKMRDVAARGRTVLFVSHSMPAVESLTTRCLFLRNGIVVLEGDSREVVSQYLAADDAAPSGATNAWRHRGDGPQRIIGLTCRDRDGSERRTFYPTEDIYLQITIESPESNQWDAAFALESNSSHPLFASHLTDFSPICSCTGILRFVIKLAPNLLRHGRYLISTGVYSPDRRTCHDEILHYPILDIDGHSPNVPSDSRWGAFYLPLRWDNSENLFKTPKALKCGLAY